MSIASGTGGRRPGGRFALLPDGSGAFFRRRIREFSGLVLMLLGAALVLAWLTAVPEDPTLNRATSAPVRNLLGAFGADMTDLGLQTLGAAYALLILITLAWGWRYLTHRSVSHIAVRVVFLPLALLLAAVACGAVPGLGTALGIGNAGGFIGRLALGRFAAWGPLIGGASAGTIGLGCGFAATVLTVWLLGFSPGEWKRFGLGAAGAMRKGASSGGRFGSQAARTGIDMALKQFRREPRLHDDRELQGPPAPAGGGLRATREDRLEPSIEPRLDLGDRKPARGEPRIEPMARVERTPKREPARRQATLDLVPDDQYRAPPTDLLAKAPPNQGAEVDQEQMQQNARLLEAVLQDFGVRGEIVKVRPGPVVTLYELEPAPGTKSARVIGLADDIARSMSAIAVRIAVVPGRSVIGIELPNQRRETVYLNELLTDAAYEQTAAKLALVLGKDIGGAPIVIDLARMPHLLIAGTTGSGKSVGINTMILSLVYRLPPEICRFIMIDPKMLELSVYDGIPHLLAPVVTEPKKAVVALKWVVREMEKRYRKMSAFGVRNIEGYNARCAEMRRAEEQKGGSPTTRRVQVGFDEVTGEPLFEDQPIDSAQLPYIVVVVDEMADLMLVAGKDIEAAIQRLAQMARAAGIHIIMATQRPSVDVITGTIKANFPTRVSFQVTSKIDSRTILGESGAEQLLGQGDMLYMAGGGRITRVHGPFVADHEVEAVVRFLKSQGTPDYLEAITEEEEEEGAAGGFGGGNSESGDDLYDQAVALVARERKASTSFVQRHLQIGYNRAARLIERMEQEGVVSAANHVGRRDVLAPRGPER